MLRAFTLAILASVLAQASAVQDGRSVLHVKVTVPDAAGAPTAVPRHVLLVSDSPATGLPRRLQTGPDGTASVRLPPGRYVVESDQPVAFGGRSYQWTQFVDVPSGRDVVLALTGDNAEVAAAAAVPGAPAGEPEAEPSSLLLRWQDSVVAVWSPTARASGFLVDRRGLVVTTQRAIGTAASAEVQIAPATKVMGRVLAANPERDVAVLWIAPQAAASMEPVPLGCAQPPPRGVAEGDGIVAIGAPLRRPKAVISGRVRAIEGRAIVANLVLGAGGTGGPVFGTGGRVVGITSLGDEDGDGRALDPQVIRIEEVCASASVAEGKMKEGVAPDARQLPVEPARAFPVDALQRAAAAPAPLLDRYRVPSSAYDVTFITPPMAYAARNQPARKKDRGRSGGRGSADPRTIDPLDEFGNWSAYVADYPPVLMVRATPKLVEGFWTRLARGAARAQGAAIPPIKRFKPGFMRLQAFCGDVEVTPIHPFRIEQRVSEAEAIYEGLYVFDPSALGPACGTVRLVLYSEKEPGKGETRAVDGAVIRQIWDDFAAYRNQGAP